MSWQICGNGVGLGRTVDHKSNFAIPPLEVWPNPRALELLLTLKVPLTMFGRWGTSWYYYPHARP